MPRDLIELLSPRLFLSADLAGSRLSITGTSGDDVIIVHLNKRFINLLTIAINGEQVAHYALAAVGQVHVDAGDGNDKVWIDSSLDPMTYPTTLIGGAGDDVLTGGAGLDHIDTGDGNDKAYGNAGGDVITGGAGRDSIWGGIGDDNINAGAGNDRVSGEVGKDVIAGEKGNDAIYGGPNEDVVHDSGGTNTIDLGEGNDSAPKLFGGGEVRGGPGDDVVVAVGGARVFGDDGNDKLQSWWVDGGAGNDTLDGLMGDDEIRGGAGDDVLRGYDGADVLSGDAGNDALFGGVGTDALLGGDGNDNLYGTNGHADKYKALGGNDDGFGQQGSDWFETDYRWNKADRDGREDRPVVSQNSLGQDPSAGQYTSGEFLGGTARAGTLALGSFDSVTLSSGWAGSTLTLNGGNLITSGVGGLATVGGSVTLPIVRTTSLGAAGWLSSGAYDPASEAFVPPAMAHKERIRAGRVILEIPKGWNLGGITAARDDVVWYQVWRDGATPPATPLGQSPLTVTSGTLTLSSSSLLSVGQVINVTSAGSLQVNGVASPPGSYVWTGTGVAPLDEEAAIHRVPTLAGTAANVVESTPHLYDGVENGAYRYLGVKRGTILVGGNASTVAQPKWTALDTPLLALPGDVSLRISGYERVFEMSSRYDAVPQGGPKVRGIAVDGGAIWLPPDGTEPYFSSGKR